MLVLLIARSSDNTTITAKPNHSSRLSLVVLWECDYPENPPGLLEYAKVLLDPEATKWIWVGTSIPAIAVNSSQWTASHDRRYPTLRSPWLQCRIILKGLRNLCPSRTLLTSHQTILNIPLNCQRVPHNCVDLEGIADLRTELRTMCHHKLVWLVIINNCF